ncbi:MAG TPA: hypothetical protein VGQ52_04875 [Gemmatimonadaceae bacterium]|jgi:uncharacterized protein YybS (DUF2232 family)|nr:hypothetical protein [Gemmatimonadaceae bacterium]
MKKFTLLAAAALVAVAVGTSTLSAQDTTRKESKGEVMMKPTTVAALVTVIDAALVNAGKLSAIKPDSPPALEFVDVKPIIATEADEKIIKEALEKNKDGLKQIESILKENTTFKAAREANPAQPSGGDVVGIDVQEGNKVIIYFWKR